MQRSSRFVHFVGRLPFPGRHDIIHDYRQASRAARQGDLRSYEDALAGIRRLRNTNGVIALGSPAPLIWFASQAIAERSALNAAEAAFTLVSSAGFGLAAVAQHIIHKRAQRLQVAPQPPIDQPPPEPIPFERPSLLEQTVLTTGAIGGMAIDAHMITEVFGLGPAITAVVNHFTS